MRRHEGLGDGVFAIVMTLLVLELRLPEAEGAHATLASRLPAMWPNYVSYLVSFLFLALWWLVNNSLLELVRRMNGPLLWLNFLFLMLITLIPFSASLAAENWGDPMTGVLYGLNLLLPLVVARAMYFLIARTPEIAVSALTPEAVRREGRGYLVTIALLASGVVVSLFNTVISFILYGVMAAFYVVVIWQGREGLAATQVEESTRETAQAEEGQG